MKKYIWQEILNNLDMVKQCVDCGGNYMGRIGTLF